MLLYANEQYEPAEACFARAHALAPTEPRWAYTLGRTQVYLAHYDRAIASLGDALRLEAGYLPARLMLARSLLEAGRADDSRALYRRIVEERPDTAEACSIAVSASAARKERSKSNASASPMSHTVAWTVSSPSRRSATRRRAALLVPFSMGTDFGDYDNDGWLDITKSNFSFESSNLYHNERDGHCVDQSKATGAIAVPLEVGEDRGAVGAPPRLTP